jgi:hypothetical protein
MPASTSYDCYRIYRQCYWYDCLDVASQGVDSSLNDAKVTLTSHKASEIS